MLDCENDFLYFILGPNNLENVYFLINAEIVYLN